MARISQRRRQNAGQMTRLVLPGDLRLRILEEARIACPRECCGLLEGLRTEDGEEFQVTALHPSEPSPVSPTTGPQWERVRGAIAAVHPEAIVTWAASRPVRIHTICSPRRSAAALR